MVRRIVTFIISALLVLLFTYAAISKLLDYSTFKFQLGRSPFLTGISGTVVWLLPVIELLVVVLLLGNKTRLAGLYGSFILMMLFTGYIYAMLHYSDYVPCSCGGILSNMSWNQHFIFNIVFSILALLGIVCHDKKAGEGVRAERWPIRAV